MALAVRLIGPQGRFLLVVDCFDLYSRNFKSRVTAAYLATSILDGEKCKTQAPILQIIVCRTGDGNANALARK